MLPKWIQKPRSTQLSTYPSKIISPVKWSHWIMHKGKWRVTWDHGNVSSSAEWEIGKRTLILKLYCCNMSLMSLAWDILYLCVCWGWGWGVGVGCVGGAERQGEGMNRQYKKWYSKSDKKRSIYWVEKDCIFSHS